MFQGSIVAIITPWKNGEIDRDTFAKLIDFQIENGTSAIVPCGTTGESATMSHEEHHEVIRFTIEQVKGRVPVIAGTGSNNTAEALDLTVRAKEMGADGALLISPYYNKPTQEGIFQHYKHIADKAQLPLVVYNCPGRTGSCISPDTIARLSEVPNVVALKDAVGDIDHTSEVVSKCEITVLSGNDSMNLPIMALGGKGAISVLANIVPAATAKLCDAMLKKDLDTALALHKKYMHLCQTLFIESNPIPVKAAAAHMGLCDPEVRMPLVPITDGAMQKLLSALKDVGIA